MKVVKDLGIQVTNSGHRKRFVLAECDCGNIFKVALNAIRSRNTKSCGCGIHRPKPITEHPEYWLLQNIKTRCYNPKRKYYYLYGGRGITVCEEWLNDAKTFIDFCKKNGYKKGLYIDRIDPNKGYFPENCRFVNATINATNQRLLSKSNKSGYRGVSKHIDRKKETKWRARITINNKIISLGVFDYKKEAAIAYDNYVIKNNLEHPLNFATKLKIS